MKKNAQTLLCPKLQNYHSLPLVLAICNFKRSGEEDLSSQILKNILNRDIFSLYLNSPNHIHTTRVNENRLMICLRYLTRHFFNNFYKGQYAASFIFHTF